MSHPFNSFLLTIVIALTAGCGGPEQQADAAPSPPLVESNRIHLYARLFAPQSQASAQSQYIPDLQQALTKYQNISIAIEEIRGAQDTIESIGISFAIEAPVSDTEAIEQILTETLRQSGAPYATQVFVVMPD